MGKHIIIKNARCSFPQLYGSQVKEDGQTFNPGITVLMTEKEHGDAIKKLKFHIKECIDDNAKLKKQPPKGEKLCLKGPSSDSWRDEFEGYDFLLKAGCPKAPVVLHKNMERMTEADNKIYSGCYVNVKVELWGQANQYGRRVNAKLLAVQFVNDGDSFDSSYVSEETAAEGFGSLDGDFEKDVSHELNAPDVDDLMG